MRRRLPAYACEIAAARKSGLAPASGEVIVSLDVWTWGKPQGGLARCLVPADRDIAEIDLTFLAGLDVLLAWSPAVTAAARLQALCQALLGIRPRRLLLLNMAADASPRIRWLKAAADGEGLKL